jgi:hypothetical protein
LKATRRLKFTPSSPITNFTILWAALSVARCAINEFTRANFTNRLVDQMALSALSRNTNPGSSTGGAASAVVTPFAINAWSLRAKRRVLACHRAEESASTVVTAGNTTA